MDWSITAVPYRAKARPLRPRRSCFGPAGAALRSILTKRTGPTLMGLETQELHRWSRRVLPPGPIGLLRRPFIAIAGLAAGRGNIGARGLRRKGAPPPSFRDGQRPGPESITAILSVSLGRCSILSFRDYGFRARDRSAAQTRVTALLVAPRNDTVPANAPPPHSSGCGNTLSRF